MPRNAGKSTGWITEICGVLSANGRRLAPDSERAAKHKKSVTAIKKVKATKEIINHKNCTWTLNGIYFSFLFLFCFVLVCKHDLESWPAACSLSCDTNQNHFAAAKVPTTCAGWVCHQHWVSQLIIIMMTIANCNLLLKNTWRSLANIKRRIISWIFIENDNWNKNKKCYDDNDNDAHSNINPK